MKAALLVALAACSAGRSDRELADVKRADLVVAVDVDGELEATEATDVDPPTLRDFSSFKVTWLADDGADVAAGDPVVKLDPAELDRSLETLRSDADEAAQRLAKRREEAALARRESELRILEAEASARKAALKAETPANLVASLDLRSQQLDNELARMTLAQAKEAAGFSASSDANELSDLATTRAQTLRRIEQLQGDAAKLAVVAPRAGTVVYQTWADGSKRKIDDTVYQNQPILQIVELGSMIGNGVVDEVDVGKIAPHAPVTLRLDALPDLQLHGTLDAITSEVRPRSDTDRSKVVRVRLALAPVRGAGMRPGMRFRGQIELSRDHDVLQIPEDAVIVTGDTAMVDRAAPSGVERVPVQLGRRSGDSVEVLAGLVAGDRVALPAHEGGEP